MSAVLKSVPPKGARTVNVNVSTYIDTDVDIDLADIPTEDLADELAEREGVAPYSLMAIYNACGSSRRRFSGAFECWNPRKLSTRTRSE